MCYGLMVMMVISDSLHTKASCEIKNTRTTPSLTTNYTAQIPRLTQNQPVIAYQTLFKTIPLLRLFPFSYARCNCYVSIQSNLACQTVYLISQIWHIYPTSIKEQCCLLIWINIQRLSILGNRLPKCIAVYL